MRQARLFPAPAPRVTAEDVDEVIKVLSCHGWRTSRWLLSHYAFGSDRRLRALAAASQGRIISGQRGYARTDHASVEDVQHAADWLSHQGHAMIRRSIEIRRAMHQHTRRTA